MAGITLRCVAPGAAASKMASERMWGKTAGRACGAPDGPEMSIEQGGVKFLVGCILPGSRQIPLKKVEKCPKEHSNTAAGVGVTLRSAASPYF